MGLRDQQRQDAIGTAPVLITSQKSNLLTTESLACFRGESSSDGRAYPAHQPRSDWHDTALVIMSLSLTNQYDRIAMP